MTTDIDRLPEVHELDWSARPTACSCGKFFSAGSKTFTLEGFGVHVNDRLADLLDEINFLTQDRDAMVDERDDVRAALVKANSVGERSDLIAERNREHRLRTEAEAERDRMLATIARVEALVEAAEFHAEHSLSRTFTGETFPAVVVASALRAALAGVGA